MSKIALSLFNGMGCGAIVLQELSIDYKYYYSEIDKFANHQQKLNFSNSISLGDITKWKEWDIEWAAIDLILAGSPCQGFSFAGKQLNFSDERSKLFFVFIDIINHVKKLNPDVKFLLENVNMKKEYLRIISEYLGIFPENINSSLVSAQNRNRWYWTNIKTKNIGLFDELYTDIPQPEDKGILLKDVLQDESEIDEKYYLSNEALMRAFKKEYSSPQIEPEKTGTLNTKNNSWQCSFDSGTTLIKGLDINQKAPTQRSSTGRCLDDKHNYQIIKLDKQLNQKADQNKSGCLTAGAHSGGNHSDMDIIAVSSIKETLDNGLIRENFYDVDNNLISKENLNLDSAICVSMVGRKIDENGIRKDYNPELKAVQRLEPKTDGKTNCLTSVQKDNLIITKNYIQDNSNKRFEQANRYYFDESKSSTLGVGNAMKSPNIITNYKLRRLTPTECARLQTVPEWYKWDVSDTQQYKMLGNGWTCDVIKHILSYL